jgi:hypothetical protein
MPNRLACFLIVLACVHVRGIDRTVHAETVEDGFGLVDQGLGIGMGMNWVRSVLPSL